MRIKSIRIKNLRSFDDTIIPLNHYTCLVGPNGSGKSTILCALNIFFRQTEDAATDLSQLDREDFHQKNTADPIEITIVFGDLSEEAKKDLADYYRQDMLIVSAKATFNEGTGKADVKQYGQRLGLLDFKDFFRAVGDNKPVADLRKLYVDIRTKFTDLPAPGAKAAMIETLRKYESDHSATCELIPSEDQFYGFRGTNRLTPYVQWVYVPAVKDATTEQVEARNSALGKLLARTVRAKTSFDDAVKSLRDEMQKRYEALMGDNQQALKDLSSSLSKRITEWAHPGATVRLEWHQDPEKSIRVEEPVARIIAGEGEFEGELARFGHGLQRSYLLALLQELASADDSGAPRLILGCEEPELYQHPPQARHLAALLEKLGAGNSQIIVSTHSPVFVSGEGFENVRMVRKDAANRRSGVRHMAYDEIASAIAAATGGPPIKPSAVLAKINQTLQPSLNEMFFATRLILVEGLEDLAYISAYMNLLGKWDEYRRLGCDIVAVNGKSQLIQPLVIAKHLQIPTFVVFDSDSGEQVAERRLQHEKDNKALLALFGQTGQDAMPNENVWGAGFVMWNSEIGTVVSDEIGAVEWQRFQAEADKHYGHAGNLRKNTLHIAASLTYAWDAGHKSASLERLCTEILNPTSNVQQ